LLSRSPGSSLGVGADAPTLCASQQEVADQHERPWGYGSTRPSDTIYPTVWIEVDLGPHRCVPAGRSAEDRTGGSPRDLSVGSASRMTARRSPSVVTRLAISSRVIRPRPLARRRWASAVAHSAWPDRNVRSPEHGQQRGLADLLDALAPGVSRFPGWARRRQSRPAASVRSAIPTARSCAAWRLAARELSGANTSGRRSGSRRSRIRCRDSPCP